MIEQLVGQLLANHERIERYRTRAIRRATVRRGRIAQRTTPASTFHELRRQLEEHSFYPAHKPRKATAQYRAVHTRLLNANGCMICRVTNKPLKSAAARVDLSLNPYGAVQLETHHHVIEWALTNAVDPDKFNELVLPLLQGQYGKNKYPRALTARQVAAWIDHDEDNLWVLCDVHHRARFFGIHEITDPVWGAQNVLKGQFIARVRTEIAKRKPKK